MLKLTRYTQEGTTYIGAPLALETQLQRARIGTVLVGVPILVIASYQTPSTLLRWGLRGLALGLTVFHLFAWWRVNAILPQKSLPAPAEAEKNSEPA